MCHGQNLRKFVDELTSNEGVDITLYLELEFQFVQGLLCIKGPYEMLRRFIDVMIKTGMEKCLAFTGWMTACHFTSVVDPVVAEIVFFRKPSTPAVSLDLVQAFIHSALVTLAMPRLKAEAHDAIKAKVKLWGVSIFQDLLPRNLPIQDILDIWDQVATITNSEKVMRLASHTGSSANPDFALRHYSRCGPNDETVATLSFLGAVHGGGPGGNKISNP